MPNNVNQQSFFGPSPQALAAALNPNLALQEAQLGMQGNLAGQMQQDGLTPINPNRSAGRFAVPISPLEGMAKMAQAYLGTKMQQDVLRRQVGVNQQMMGNLLRYTQPQGNPVPQAGAGGTTPPAYGQPGFQPLPPGPMPQGQAVPQAPAGFSPDYLRLAAVNAVYGPQAGQVAAASMMPTDIEKIADLAQRGVPWAQDYLRKQTHIPLEQMRQGSVGVDPVTGKPSIVNPRLPTGQMPDYSGGDLLHPGTTLPTGYGQAVTAQSNIPQPGAPMQTVKVSNQRELQLTQPEYLRYTQSGGQLLPSRYAALARELPGVRFQDAGGQAPQMPQAAPVPQTPQVPRPQMPAAPSQQTNAAPVSGSGLTGDQGVVGATQSQNEQVQQSRQTAAGKAVDEQFAKDYVAFTSGGGAQDAAKQLAQLEDVTKMLQEGNHLTGPVRGMLPDTVRNITNPEAVEARERVEEVVQRSLRAILGAQFTENEGKRLIARAYNPSLPESENLIRVNRLLTQLHQAFDAKQSASRYFEQNGTLAGWKGKLPSISDFNPDQGSLKSAPQPMYARNPQTGARIMSTDGGKSWRPAGATP